MISTTKKQLCLRRLTGRAGRGGGSGGGGGGSRTKGVEGVHEIASRTPRHFVQVNKLSLRQFKKTPAINPMGAEKTSFLFFETSRFHGPDTDLVDAQRTHFI